MFMAFASSSTQSALRYTCILGYIVVLASSSCDTSGTGQLCNGRLDLCDRPLSNVSFPGTHNSFAHTEDGFLISTRNQNHNVRQQLDDGIRYVNFDVYPDDASDALVLCHGLCSLGKTDFGETCRSIVEFLEANPNEVVVINMEDKANTSSIATVMTEAGLAAYTHTYNASSPLTLREMIAAGERVVVMRQDSISCMETPIPECQAPAWMHYTWDLVKRTDWEFSSIDSFTCQLRVTGGEPFFMISHWINPSPAILFTQGREPSAMPANQWDVLQARAQQCWTEAGFPNFVVVDYYDHGHVLQVADWVNDNVNLSATEVAALSSVPLPAPCETSAPTATPPTPAPLDVTTAPPAPTPTPSAAPAGLRGITTAGLLAAAAALVIDL